MALLLKNLCNLLILLSSVPVDKALSTIKPNPANVLKLSNKGCVKEGIDGDIVLLENTTLEIDTAIDMGKTMVLEGNDIAKGTFE